MNIKDIISKIANFFGYSYEQLLGKNISHKISQARNFAYYILHVDCRLSSNAIATAMNRKTRHIVRQNATTKYRINNFKQDKELYENIKKVI